MKDENRTTAGYVAVLIVGLFVATAGHAGDKPTCEELAASWQEYPELQVKEVSKATEERELNRRPCLKSYPWPQGEFFDDDPESGDVAVSSERMLEIHRKVIELTKRYSALERLGPELGVARYLAEAEGDIQAVLVGYRLSSGMDKKLLGRFGVILYLLVLRKEGNLEELLSVSSRLIERMELKPGLTSLDVLEENTYFSGQFQKNIILLLRASALAEIGTDTLEEGLEELRAFLGMRETLRPQMQMFGDPFYLLFENAGCDPPDAAY